MVAVCATLILPPLVCSLQGPQVRVTGRPCKHAINKLLNSFYFSSCRLVSNALTFSVSFVRAVPVILIFRISFLRGPFLCSSILSPSSEMPSLSHNRAHSDSFHLVITVAEDILQPTNSNGFHVCFIMAHDRDSREFLISRRQWLSRNLLTSPLGTGLSTIFRRFFQRQEQLFSHCVLDFSLHPFHHQMINVKFSASRGVTVTCTR